MGCINAKSMNGNEILIYAPGNLKMNKIKNTFLGIIMKKKRIACISAVVFAMCLITLAGCNNVKFNQTENKNVLLTEKYSIAQVEKLQNAAEADGERSCNTFSKTATKRSSSPYCRKSRSARCRSKANIERCWFRAFNRIQKSRRSA